MNLLLSIAKLYSHWKHFLEKDACLCMCDLYKMLRTFLERRTYWKELWCIVKQWYWQTLNATWAWPNALVDIFLDNFHWSERIKYLLNHLVITMLDHVTYDQCIKLQCMIHKRFWFCSHCELMCSWSGKTLVSSPAWGKKKWVNFFQIICKNCWAMIRFRFLLLSVFTFTLCH